MNGICLTERAVILHTILEGMKEVKQGKGTYYCVKTKNMIIRNTSDSFFHWNRNNPFVLRMERFNGE